MTDESLQYCQNDVLLTRDAAVEHEHFMKRCHKLVLDNENLIYYVIKKLGIYKDIDNFYDISMIGLCKAARSFDSKSNTKFSTYAISCIRNELYSYGRKKVNKQWFNMLSLDVDVTGCEVPAIELIPDDIDVENSVIEKETNKELYNAISQLSDIEQLVINCSYGLNGYMEMSQHDILILLKRNYKTKYNYSQSYISRIKGRAIKKLKRYLKNYKEI